MQKGRSTKREPADAASCFLRRHYPDQVRGFPGSHPLLSAGHTQLPFFDCDYSLVNNESQEPDGLLSLVWSRGETCQCPLFRSRSIADSCSAPLFSCLSKRRGCSVSIFSLLVQRESGQKEKARQGKGFRFPFPWTPSLKRFKRGLPPLKNLPSAVRGEKTKSHLRSSKASSCRNVGVNQRRGEVPSFVVSIRGSFEGGRNRNLPPSNVVLFSVPFLLDKQEKRGDEQVSSLEAVLFNRKSRRPVRAPRRARGTDRSAPGPFCRRRART